MPSPFPPYTDYYRRIDQAYGLHFALRLAKAEDLIVRPNGIGHYVASQSRPDVTHLVDPITGCTCEDCKYHGAPWFLGPQGGRLACKHQIAVWLYTGWNPTL